MRLPVFRIPRKIQGKPGTTQNASDGWFVAVTNDIVAGAWVGGDDRAIHFTHWPDGQGARTAMPIVALFLQDIYADSTLNLQKTVFQRPPNLSMEIDCQKFVDVLTPTDTTIYDDDIY